MRRKGVLLVLLAVSVFLFCEVNAYAQQGGGGRRGARPGQARTGKGTDGRPAQAVDKPWERKADGNKDGVVDKTENQQWKEQKAEVYRPWEKRADANQDGVVDDVEIRQWKFRQHHRGNRPHGQAGAAEESSDSE